MTDGSQFIDIILFAMVAVFLGLRLRSVLGRRTGNERPPAELGFDRTKNGTAATPPSNAAATPPGNNVIDMGQRRRAPADSGGEAPVGGTLGAGLDQISRADPNFTAEGFLEGARAAFEMIVQAFARGDDATLRPLLADEVFDNFVQAIQGRAAAHEICQSELLHIVSADLVDASMDGRIARISVRFVSQQIIVVRDAHGNVIEGDPAHPAQIIDLWSFARDPRSPNPNWLLVATRSLDE
jgi:predicted lipid-binding transport protein (Tim44 family)